jgi:hypothetical protein
MATKKLNMSTDGGTQAPGVPKATWRPVLWDFSSWLYEAVLGESHQEDSSGPLDLQTQHAKPAHGFLN